MRRFSQRLEFGSGEGWGFRLGLFSFAVMFENFPFPESSNNFGSRVNAFPEKPPFDVFSVRFEVGRRELRRWDY